MEEGSLGAAGRTVLIEEYLSGQEISVFGLSDGETILTIGVACDYKRAGDGDAGPNTGGMGAYAPVPIVDATSLRSSKTTILQPTIRDMAAQGVPFKGILYAGLILTTAGPKVIEFNARLGDPETQVVLPLLHADLPTLFAAVAHGTLGRGHPAAHRPPGPPSRSSSPPAATPVPTRPASPSPAWTPVPDDVLVFHAGTRHDESGDSSPRAAASSRSSGPAPTSPPPPPAPTPASRHHLPRRPPPHRHRPPRNVGFRTVPARAARLPRPTAMG